MTLLDRMALGLGVPTSYILKLAHSASHCYKEYSIPKRNGESRTIHHPSRELKAIQRWLLTEVISTWPVHSAAMAYRTNVSTKHNAERHVDSRYLLRMDFNDFFGSIRYTDIQTFLSAHPELTSGWSSIDANTFAQLVCRHAALTIGAPTSPGISNALCFDLDTRLEGLAAQSGVTYTRYADDLFFSTGAPDVLRQIVQSVPSIVATLSVPAHLVVNPSKTRHASKRGARRVTGITLGSDGNVYAGRWLKRVVRAKIHKYSTLSPKDQQRLAGLIAYVQGIDPDFVNSLILKYGHALVSQARAGPL